MTNAKRNIKPIKGPILENDLKVVESEEERESAKAEILEAINVSDKDKKTKFKSLLKDK